LTVSDSYTKLFSSITASTIVSEPLATRWLWVTMLAMSDASGNVWGSVPGLARIANITLEQCEEALQCFLSPDPYSRTKEHGGRRVEAVDGGWLLLNHAKYRAVRSAEERREYMRQYMAKRREEEKKQAEQLAEPLTELAMSTEVTPPAPTPTPEKKQKQKTAPEGDLLEGIEPQVAKDFKALRSKLRAPITETAMQGIQREATKAGLSVQDALRVCCERGWRGFKAEWLKDKPVNGRAGSSAYIPLPGER
jgi:sRNA-binding protein